MASITSTSTTMLQEPKQVTVFNDNTTAREDDGDAVMSDSDDEDTHFGPVKTIKERNFEAASTHKTTRSDSGPKERPALFIKTTTITHLDPTAQENIPPVSVTANRENDHVSPVSASSSPDTPSSALPARASLHKSPCCTKPLCKAFNPYFSSEPYSPVANYTYTSDSKGRELNLLTTIPDPENAFQHPKPKYLMTPMTMEKKYQGTDDRGFHLNKFSGPPANRTRGMGGFRSKASPLRKEVKVLGTYSEMLVRQLDAAGQICMLGDTTKVRREDVPEGVGIIGEDEEDGEEEDMSWAPEALRLAAAEKRCCLFLYCDLHGKERKRGFYRWSVSGEMVVTGGRRVWEERGLVDGGVALE